jgi:hypothetical protein
MYRMKMQLEYKSLLEGRDPGRPKNGWGATLHVKRFYEQLIKPKAL